MDHPYLAPLTANASQIGLRSRNAQHVSIGTKNNIFTTSYFHRSIEHFHRRYAHRASRPMDNSDRRGQQLINAVLENCVGLPSANLHHRPILRRDASDPLHQCFYLSNIFRIEIVHHGVPGNAEISWNVERLSSARVGSNLEIANPTCTIT